MSNLSVPVERWLKELFEFEYCAECGGDACHHTAVALNGNWFARCDLPRSDGGEMHQTIFVERIARELAESRDLDWDAMHDADYSVKWSPEAVRQFWRDLVTETLAIAETLKSTL